VLEAIESDLAAVESTANRSGAIFFADNTCEVRGEFPALLAIVSPLFADLVADAPKNDARMIAVAANQRPQICLVPVCEEPMVVVTVFAFGPAIERFVHD
jgi:hypothetical protein